MNGKPKTAKFRRPWTAAEDALLALHKPARVVELTGRTASAVGNRRRELRLAGHRPQVPWTAAEDRTILRLTVAQACRVLPGRSYPAIWGRKARLESGEIELGKRHPFFLAKKRLAANLVAKIRKLARTTPVATLAARFHLSRQSIYNAIRGQTKSLRKPGEPRTVWTSEQDELVRTLSADEAAKRTGRSRSAIVHRRYLLGIGLRVAPPPWTAADDRLIRRLTIDEVVAQTGRSRKRVQERRRQLKVFVLAPPWTAAEDRLVLTLPLQEAVKQTGRTICAVILRKTKLRKKKRRPASPSSGR